MFCNFFNDDSMASKPGIYNMTFSVQVHQKYHDVTIIVSSWSQKRKSPQSHPLGLQEDKLLTVINMLPVIFKNKEMSKCYSLYACHSCFFD